MPHRQTARPRAQLVWEIGGLLAIAGLAIFYLSISWRRWVDPTIDFGRELYLPWRLAQGAVLYRDVDDFYGPLSQYFNAMLFKVFGAGLMTLVVANLTIFTAITALLYGLFRRAWGVGGALIASAIFVSIFAFGQYVGVGNTNYAAPYAHETTHGMLVCLGLTVILLRWIEAPSLANSALAGFLFGLTAVLKPEIMLAAGAVVVGAVALRREAGDRVEGSTWLSLGLGAIAPTLAFTLFFALKMPLAEAVGAACHAWLTATASTRYVADAVQLSFLGFDHPTANLLEHGMGLAFALIFFSLLAAGAWAVDRSRTVAAQILVGILTLGLLLWIAWTQINWARIGRCFLGLMLLYLAVQAVRYFRRNAPAEGKNSDRARILITLLAIALMARMILNGRVAHFGYYQAALAAMVVPAAILTELPRWLRLQPGGRRVVALGTVLSATAGVVILSVFSIGIYRVKTFEIGRGADKFYTMAPAEDPMGVVVNAMLGTLDKTPPAQTMLVLPEGLMLNYLTRKISPVSPFFFFSAATSGGRELELVKKLEHNPPDWVMVISRDLSEYGITRYGEAPGNGQEMLAWVDKNYELTASIGADPFERGQRAARLYSHRIRSP